MPDGRDDGWRRGLAAAPFRTGIGPAEGRIGDRDVEFLVAEVDPRAVVLRIERDPAAQAQAAGRRAVADEHHGDRAIFGALRILDLDRSEEHTSELQSLMRISYAVF